MKKVKLFLLIASFFLQKKLKNSYFYIDGINAQIKKTTN